MKRRLLAASGLCIALLASPALSADGANSEGSTRPQRWAQPLEVEGVRNLYKISDDLYRSAQPQADSLQHLDDLGIQTIVSVRYFHSGRRPTEGTDITYERIAMMPWKTQKKKVVEFLRIFNDAERTPVLLHCYKGADRTGMLAAMYRIVIQDWTKEAAIEEMKGGGYGYNSLWSNLIRWIEKADIEEIRDLAGISSPDN